MHLTLETAGQGDEKGRPRLRIWAGEAELVELVATIARAADGPQFAGHEGETYTLWVGRDPEGK